MVDPSSYRAAPDPEFADRLERLLLRRLTAEPDRRRTSREVAQGHEPVRPDTDANHRGDLIMLETEDRPTGNQPPTPRRRSPSTWLMVAAAAVVVAVVGTLLVAAGDDEDKQLDTATSTPTTGDDEDKQLDTATSTPTTAAPTREAMVSRSVDPDGDGATPLRVTFEVPTGDWSFWSWFGAVKFLPGDADGFTGLSITTVTNLVSDGCEDHTPLDPPVGPTVDDLATALSQLAPFEVTAPPTDVTLFGYQGKHLELTVPAMRVAAGARGKNTARFVGCVDSELHSWISPINVLRDGWPSSPGLLGHAGTPYSTDSLGAFNAYQTPGQTEEFWILDVEGTRLVLVNFDTPLAPPADIAERNAIFDSIRIEP